MSLQDQATRRSGVKQEDAFALDEVNLFQRLGLETFVKLSTKFYTRVYDDDQEWFRKIFANSTKEDAIRNQYEFFVQRMGGPALYSQRKGHPALIGRHGPFTVNEQAAERWLEHMQAALNEVDEIDADSKKRMSDFFKHSLFLGGWKGDHEPSQCHVIIWNIVLLARCLVYLFLQTHNLDDWKMKHVLSSLLYFYYKNYS